MTLYSSTRGKVKNISFEETVMMGLADDGGLLIPNKLPQVNENLKKWRSLDYKELSLEIISLFTKESIPRKELNSIIQKSYNKFRNPKITPIKKVGNIHILELFHGPTFAFKDIALQFLGNIFEYFLKARQHPLRILGATSGDTGSAAIYGLKGKKGIEVFMLFPKGRVSPIQERQMTTILDPNIYNLSIEGSFDDAQLIVKKIFNNHEFKHNYYLASVNSINWARILAQIVYYFFAWFRITKSESELVNFVVPTGNFGNILAGYYAKRMGLPIDKLVIGTNENDILHRFFKNGEYNRTELKQTLSPSMDIQVSSNFERYLFYLAGNSFEKLKLWMHTFENTGRFNIGNNLLKVAKKDFISASVKDKEVIKTIQKFHTEFQYILDPHTAVGVCASEKVKIKNPTICLACAHPAKFIDTINNIIGFNPVIPKELANLNHLETKFETVSCDEEFVKKLILNHVKLESKKKKN
tara:strand:- start:954 stop:2363 length:1410 start_codon:yes stop_codon:yes gene_type:complete